MKFLNLSYYNLVKDEGKKFKNVFLTSTIFCSNFQLLFCKNFSLLCGTDHQFHEWSPGLRRHLDSRNLRADLLLGGEGVVYYRSITCD